MKDSDIWSIARAPFVATTLYSLAILDGPSTYLVKPSLLKACINYLSQYNILFQMSVYASMQYNNNPHQVEMIYSISVQHVSLIYISIRGDTLRRIRMFSGSEGGE